MIGDLGLARFVGRGLAARFLTALCVVTNASGIAIAVPSGLPQPTIPECLGVNIHFAGPEDEQVEQIAAAGFRFVRMDFTWSNVESVEGRYDFTPYDELVESLSRHSIRPVFILDYGNPHYDGGAAPHTDEGRKAFADFARASAAHLKDAGVLWEIWNEPNLSGFWKPASNVEDYVKLAKAAYRALKEGDPNCTVLAPALSGMDYLFLEAAFKVGLLEATDVVSLHPYGAAKPEDAAEYYQHVRELIRNHAPRGKEVPIVSGEWGYSAVGGISVETQAEYLARMFVSNLMNSVALSIWYDWRDDGPDPNEREHHFGTVYQDFKPKPAYLAAKTLTTELAGFRSAVRLYTESDSDYLALFTNGDHCRLAAWTTGEPHKIRTPLDVEAVDVVSLTGERQRVEVKDGSLEIDLTGAVRYVEPVGTSPRWAAEAAWTIAASTYWIEDGIAARIVSESLGLNGELSASGPGLQPGTTKPAGQGAKLDTPFVHSGKGKAKVRVTLAVEGLKSPLVRVVEIDTAACPKIQVQPPAQQELWFEIERPGAELAKPFKGAVYVGNTRGVRLAAESCKFEIPPGETRTHTRIKMTQDPSAVYSFSYKLCDSKSNDIIRVPAARYSVLETFADGKPGSEVRRYQIEPDGDPEVPASAKLTYISSPPGAPEDVCAKLDYEFGEGWRFVRISPKPPLPIAEKPSGIRLWIKGDGQGGMARLRFRDSDGQVFQQDYGQLDFTEWRCIDAKLTGDGAGHWGGKNDGVVRYPVSWDTIFLLDNTGRKKTKGSICLGTMMVCYED